MLLFDSKISMNVKMEENRIEFEVTLCLNYIKQMLTTRETVERRKSNLETCKNVALVS